MSKSNQNKKNPKPKPADRPGKPGLSDDARKSRSRAPKRRECHAEECKEEARFCKTCKKHTCGNCHSCNKPLDCSNAVDVLAQLAKATPKVAAAIRDQISHMEQKELGEKDAELELARDRTNEAKEREEKQPVVVSPPCQPEVTETEKPEPRKQNNWDQFEDTVYHHFASSKIDSNTLKVALNRVPNWLNSVNVPREGDTLRRASETVCRIYQEHWSPVNTWRFWWNEKKWAAKQWLLTRWWLSLLPVLLVVLSLHFMSWKQRLKYCVPALAIIRSGLVLTYRRWKHKPNSLLTSKVPYLTDWCTTEDKNYKFLPFKNLLCWLKLPVYINSRHHCTETKFLVGFTTAPDHVWCSRLCWHNEHRSLKNRQLLPALSTKTERKRLWKICFEAFNKLFPCPNTEIGIPLEEKLEMFLAKYPLTQRQALRRAFQTTVDGHYVLNPNSSCFVKREWNVFKPIEKRDPRCISSKTFDYLVASSPDYYIMQKAICKEYYSDIDRILHTRQKFIYTGGMTPDQIGAIVSHYENLGWHFYEGDFKKYDGHNEFEALDSEFKWYVLPSGVKAVLRKQLVTRGSTKSGLKFKHDGKVGSGVINTSFGNTKRGFMIIAGWCSEQGIEDYVVIQLGDDNILMFKNPIDLGSLVEHCARLGHELIVVHRPDLDYLEYCSGRFYDVGGVRILAPKIGRVLAKTFISTDPNMMPDQLGSYVTQIAEGFKYYRWIPCFGTFIDKILDAGLTQRKYKLRENPYAWRLRHTVEVDEEAVVRFFTKVYGFEPYLLDFSGWTPQVGTALHHPMLDAVMMVDGVIPPK